MPTPTFNLTRWLSITALACVAAISLAAAQLLSHLFTDRLLRRDAEVTMEFVQSLVAADAVADGFARAADPGRRAALEDTFRHIAQMPDVLRANVYAADRSVLWSTDASLAGRRFEDNDELDDALAGRLVFDSGPVRKEEHLRALHPFSEKGVSYFIEIYVPIRARGGQIVGVVELYKKPDALSEAIHASRRLIWASAIGGSALLFAALFLIARRADLIMRDQQRRLVEAETLALVGEMASAVAHAVRSPLSSIRTSAEMALEEGAGPTREQAQDIVGAVDRIEGWVRDLLGFSRPISGRREAIDPNSIIRRSTHEFERDLARREVLLETKLQDGLPPVRGDDALLGQVLNSLIANAADAVSGPGRIEVASRLAGDRRHVEIDVADTGVGIEAEQLDKVFKPFFTTKPRGLGLGLALAKRVLERYDGTLSVVSHAGSGTTFTVRLPAAA